MLLCWKLHLRARNASVQHYWLATVTMEALRLWCDFGLCDKVLLNLSLCSILVFAFKNIAEDKETKASK